MRIWAEINYNPPSDNPPLLSHIFEALFCWDPDLVDRLPQSVLATPGFRSMAKRCTGDAGLSMKIAVSIMAAAHTTRGSTSIINGVKAADSDPQWSTVSESWDTMYSMARNDENLQQVLNWMSFFVHSLDQAVGRLPITPPERSTAFVDDLGEVLPEELSLLTSAVPELKAEFVNKLIDGSLMGMTRPVVVEEPCGPVFVLLDQSKSMLFLDQRVKGLALAIYKTVIGEGRACYIIPFSTSASDKDRWYVGGDPASFCRSFMGGGTSGFTAMNDVLNTVDTLDLCGSTIIMITDGAFNTTPRSRRSLQDRLESSSVTVGFFLVGLGVPSAVSNLGKIVHLGNLMNLSVPSVEEIATIVLV